MAGHSRMSSFPQPPPKSASTSKSNTLSATANVGTSPSNSRETYQIRSSRPGRRASQVDTSDKATIALIRRILFPPAGHDRSSTPRPVEEVLPPLTSSNEVDIQLYAIIAIIMRDYVYAWYGKITPDHAFVDEVIQIIAHCTRALEGRLRQVDLALFVFDEIPLLIEAHVAAYKIAHANHAHQTAIGCDPRHIYHTLNPHPALSPIPDVGDPETEVEQRSNEAVYRQLLVQGALAVLLPTEDLENVCLRTLVGDIVADLILGDAISKKVCQGSFIWDSITKVAELARGQDSGSQATSDDVETGRRSRLERFGLVSTKEKPAGPDLSAGHQSRMSVWFWRMLQYVYLAFVALRFVAIGLARTRSQSSSPSTPSTPVTLKAGDTSRSRSMTSRSRPPVVAYRSFGLVSQVLDLSSRMPWLTGLVSLLQYYAVAGPGHLGETDGVLDRFLTQLLQTHVLNPALLPPILQSVRTALFSHHAPPQAPPTTTITGTGTTPVSQQQQQNTIPPPMPLLATAAAPAESKSGSGAALSAAGSGRSRPDTTTTVIPSADPTMTAPPDRPTPTSTLPPLPSHVDFKPDLKAETSVDMDVDVDVNVNVGGSAGGGTKHEKPSSFKRDTVVVPAADHVNDDDKNRNRVGVTLPKKVTIVTGEAETAPVTEEQQTNEVNNDHNNTDDNHHNNGSPKEEEDNEEEEESANLERKRTSRRKCAETILDLIPPILATRLFKPPPPSSSSFPNAKTNLRETQIQEIETSILDVFSDHYLNKHFVFAILEAVLVKVLPEMERRGVMDLMGERGVVVGAGGSGR